MMFTLLLNVLTVKECQQVMSSLVFRFPWDRDMWFNLALARYECAKLRYENRISSEEMTLAIEDYDAVGPYDSLSL
jgi:hypothetical protein